MKKDTLFYALVCTLAILDILIPIFLFQWEEWAPQLFSIKRLALHGLAFISAVGIGTICASGFKAVFAKIGLLKLGVVAVGGSIVTVGYVKIAQQKVSIPKPQITSKAETIVIDSATTKPLSMKDFKFALQSNSGGDGIVAGGKYNARILVYQSSLIENFSFSANGIPLTVDKNGEVHYTESIRGGNYDKNGAARKNIKITAKLNNASDSETIELEDYYEFYKPLLSVSTASVSALYLNCSNYIRISISGVGGHFNPDYSGSSGGEVIKGSQPGLIYILPTAPTFTLKVSNNGVKIGDLNFNVKPIPLPTIEVVQSNKIINEKLGIQSFSGISIRTVADPNFAGLLPDEAIYNVGQVVVTLARGKRVVVSKKFTSVQMDFSAFYTQAQNGDRLIFEISEVARKNSAGMKERVNMGTIIKNYPINL